MDDLELVTISQDHWRSPLGVDTQQPLAASANRRLFVVALHWLADHDALEEALPVAADPTRLNLMIPGTRFHVRIGAVRDRELHELMALGAAIELVNDPKVTISLAGLYALRNLITALPVEDGQRSVVDAIAALGRGGRNDVLERLYGHPCLHPTSGCRHESNGSCTISAADTDLILKDLAARGVLRRNGPLEPPTYQITF